LPPAELGAIAGGSGGKPKHVTPGNLAAVASIRRMGIAMARKPKSRDGCDLIFRTVITLRNGKRKYAWEYGLKAFPIWVKRPEDPKDPK
jgi:hypothetical protein